MERKLAATAGPLVAPAIARPDQPPVKPAAWLSAPAVPAVGSFAQPAQAAEELLREVAIEEPDEPLPDCLKDKDVDETKEARLIEYMDSLD